MGVLMPAFLEAKLKSAAAEQGFSGKKADRYIYGAMNNMGAMRGNKETAKGARMQKKHEAKVSAAKAHGGAMKKLSDLA
jgi:hypothetical protein